MVPSSLMAQLPWQRGHEQTEQQTQEETMENTHAGLLSSDG